MKLNIDIPSGLLGDKDCEIVIRIDRNGKAGMMSAGKAGMVSASNHVHLFIYMEHRIELLKRQERVRTAETYQSTLNSFKLYRQGHDLALSDITAEMMRSYQEYLLHKGLTLNTVSFYMRILRSVYLAAVKEGLCNDQHPFDQVYTGIAKTTKRALSLDEMRAIACYQPKDKGETMARDMFMLSFCLRGMSSIDMACLRKSNLKSGLLTYQRRKTGQTLTIAWTKEMEELAHRYPSANGVHLLGLVDSTKGNERAQFKQWQRTLNYFLGKVGQALGLKERLTMYVARHSWASIAKEMDVPISVISDGMGHNSEKTTQIYLTSIDANRIDQANDVIIHAISPYTSPQQMNG